MSGDFDIDPSFYERFAVGCEQRKQRIDGLLDAWEANKLAAAQTQSSIAMELHTTAGEGKLLGLTAVGSAASEISERLRHCSGDFNPSLCALLRSAVEHLTIATCRAARGQAGAEEEEALSALIANVVRALDGHGAATTAAPSAPQEEDLPLQPRRILIVDDSDIIRTLLAVQLKEDGYPVAVAANLVEFEAALAAFKPEVVLTEINVPDVQGDDICRVLKQRFDIQNIPIVLFSSLPDAELCARAERVGADGFLSKRHGLDQLGRLLGGLLRQILS